jgi:hypothetical protein
VGSVNLVRARFQAIAALDVEEVEVAAVTIGSENRVRNRQRRGSTRRK